MEFTVDIFSRISMFVLAVAGYLVANYIHKQKKRGRPLVCPVHFDCENVVKSRYSNLFGIELEVYGILYYAFVSFVYFMLIFMSDFVLPIWFVYSLVIASASAFIFSVYLLYVQIFLLKKGCSWCFLSSTLCILIFLLTIVIYL